MAKETISSQVDRLVKDPSVQSMLGAIRRMEGTADFAGGGYGTMFGGGQISDFSKHPNQSHSYVDRNGQTINSTAAGAYQFLNSTWNTASKELGLKDFSPENQDRAAVYLMLKSGAIPYIQSNDIAGALGKLNSVWTSLPGSVEGGKHHALRSPQFALAALNAERKSRGLDDLAMTWNGATVTAPGSSFGQYQKSQANLPVQRAGLALLQRQNFPGTFLEQALGSTPTAGSFLQQALTDPVKASMYNGINTPRGFVMSANPMLNEQSLAEMEDKLNETNPNIQHGFTDIGGLRPTVSVTDPATGNTQSFAQMPDGSTVDLVNGIPVATQQTAAPEVIDGTQIQYQFQKNTEPNSTPEMVLPNGATVEELVPTWVNPEPAPQVETVNSYLAKQLENRAATADALQTKVYADPNFGVIRQALSNTHVNPPMERSNISYA